MNLKQVWKTLIWLSHSHPEINQINSTGLELNVSLLPLLELTFSSLSWSPLQSVFRETLKDFQTGLRLFMTVC